MKSELQVFKKFLSIPRGFWRWAVAAAFIAAGVCSLPATARAVVTYGTTITHQSNDVNSQGTSTSTSQDRFSFFFNVLTAPSTRLNMSGIFRFDILENNASTGTSTELQPNVDLRFSTHAVQLGGGYREIIRDEVVQSGTATNNVNTDSKDAYADMNINAGRLPFIRVRYSLRDQQQVSDAATVQDNHTNDFSAGTNYRLGIFNFNADYRKQNTKDRTTGDVTDTTQVVGQLGAVKQFGPKLTVSLRENYNLSQTKTNGNMDTDAYTSISEARANINPVAGLAATTNYIYRLSNDLVSESGKAEEKTWFSNVNYSFTRGLRVYGSYNMREQDASSQTTTENTAIWGLGFSQVFGRFSFASRYEGQHQDTTTTTGGAVASENTNQRHNIDWTLSTRLASLAALSLGESYVSTTADGKTTSNNHFRLAANLGPVKTFTAAPSMDYYINKTENGASTTNKQLSVPATFRVMLHQKLNFDVTENYRWSQNIDADGNSISSSSNNLTLRLTLSQPLPGTTFAGDATFSTNSSEGSASSSSSTYAFRASWVKKIHTFNFNARYQTSTTTGSSTASSADFTAQYGLNFRLRKLACNLQARYNYTRTFGNDDNSSQGVYISVNMRR